MHQPLLHVTRRLPVGVDEERQVLRRVGRRRCTDERRRAGILRGDERGEGLGAVEDDHDATLLHAQGMAGIGGMKGVDRPPVLPSNAVTSFSASTLSVHQGVSYVTIAVRSSRAKGGWVWPWRERLP